MKNIKIISIFFIGFLTAVFLTLAVSSVSAGLAEQASIKNLWDRILGIPPVSPPAPLSLPEPKASSYVPPLDYEEAIIRAVEENAASVVSVIVTKNLPIIERCPVDPFGSLPPNMREFFGPFNFDFSQPCEKGTRKQEVGGGSGFVVSEDGFIVTNKHVVSDRKAEYTVLTNDGQKFSAEVIAQDPAQDLALIKAKEIDGKLRPIRLGDSDGVKLGQTVIAIGNALGEFRNTISVGVISGLARNITASGGGATEYIEGLIQTDAAINPGNSGGPLLNLRGEVIGINTAVAEGAENIGFAIPINNAKRDIRSVKEHGKIVIPYLGVRFLMINEAAAEKNDLAVKNGALVRGGEDGPAVMPDSPAEKAGVQAEDIILKVDGASVDEDRSLGSLIQRHSVGDAIELEVLRAGKRLKLKATLEERTF